MDRFTVLIVSEGKWCRSMAVNNGLLTYPEANRYKKNLNDAGIEAVVVPTIDAEAELKMLQEVHKDSLFAGFTFDPVSKYSIRQLGSIIQGLEHTMETPVARRRGKKACPYCAQHDAHDPECLLNQCLVRFLDDEDTPELKADMITTLKDLGRIDHKGCYRRLTYAGI